jgi:glycosyltransferase involved in cell wall biosynthesis
MIGMPLRAGPGECRRPLRIALAMPGGFEFGGIGRIMLYVTRAWSEAAQAPAWHVVDPRGAGPALLMPWHLGRASAAFARAILAGHGPDLLHVNVAGRSSTWRKIVLAELARHLRVPYLVHLHDYDYAKDLARRGGLGRRLTRRLFGGAARVLVLGSRDRAIAASLLGVPVERIEILANGVSDPGPPPARDRHGEPVRLLFLGHLDDRKGVPELLQTLATAGLRQRSWHLTMAGGGETDRFARMVQDLGLTDRVELTGWLSHERAYKLCREADVFVLPSHAEGLAMSLLEAMAHGLAIVATPVGAHGETIADGREALLIPPGDRHELAEALIRLIDDPRLRARLGAAARARYLAQFSSEHVATRLLIVYREVLAAQGRATTP